MTTLEAVLERIVAVAQPDRVILFGSAARGTAGPHSDLDFLVIKRGIPSRRQLAQAIYRALVGIRASVDVVVVTPEDVESLKDGVGTIVGPAMREGREVYAAWGRRARESARVAASSAKQSGQVVPGADVQEASVLTDYAVAARYPGPSEPVLIEDYEKAVAAAKAVVSWVSGIVTAPFEPWGPARRIAETLGVSNVLEGSVRRAGTRIRVTAQLINAEDGYHLRSERYDRELTDVFAIQDEIAQAS